MVIAKREEASAVNLPVSYFPALPSQPATTCDPEVICVYRISPTFTYPSHAITLCPPFTAHGHARTLATYYGHLQHLSSRLPLFLFSIVYLHLYPFYPIPTLGVCYVRLGRWSVLVSIQLMEWFPSFICWQLLSRRDKLPTAAAATSISKFTTRLYKRMSCSFDISIELFTRHPQCEQLASLFPFNLHTVIDNHAFNSQKGCQERIYK